MKAEKVLIIRGNSSMGLATAWQASSKGYELIVADRNEAELKQIACDPGELESYYQVDAMNEE